MQHLLFHGWLETASLIPAPQHLQAEAEMSSFRCQQRTSEDCLFSTWKPLTGVLLTTHSACDSVKLLRDNGANPDDKNSDLQCCVFSGDRKRPITILSIPGWSKNLSIFWRASKFTFTASSDSRRFE